MPEPEPQVLRWPTEPPAYGRVRLRAFRDTDVPMVQELATDPYVPQIGSLAAHADEAEARAWIVRQRARPAEGVGFSFCVADLDDRPLGTVGLWTRDLGAGRATAGYSLAPSARGRGLAADALRAVTTFGWTLPALHRIELYVEPGNVGSNRTAERAGYDREGLLRSHQEIGGTRRTMVLWAALRPATTP